MSGKRKNLVKWKKRGFFLLKGIILAAVLFITLFPICWLVKTSISPTEDIQSGMVFPIKSVTFSHYRQLFVEKGFDTALKNSLINAVAALVLSLSFGLATAYILARKRFRFGMLPADTQVTGYQMRREALRAETFKVGHHGQANALDEELLGAVAPKYAIISASSDRRYESAAPGVLSMLHAYGTKTYFTDVPDVPPYTDGLMPHAGVAFAVAPDGSMSVRYL